VPTRRERAGPGADTGVIVASGGGSRGDRGAEQRGPVLAVRPAANARRRPPRAAARIGSPAAAPRGRRAGRWPRGPVPCPSLGRSGRGRCARPRSSPGPRDGPSPRRPGRATRSSRSRASRAGTRPTAAARAPRRSRWGSPGRRAGSRARQRLHTQVLPGPASQAVNDAGRQCRHEVTTLAGGCLGL
jgi:hypothetical protein